MAKHPILAFVCVATVLLGVIVASRGIVDHEWQPPDGFTVVLLGIVVPLSVVGTSRRRVGRYDTVPRA